MNTDDKLPEYITDDMVCVIKDDSKFYSQIFLEEALLVP